MSFDAPELKLPAMPGAPPPPPLLGASPTKKKPQQKGMQPSFLGTEAAPTTPSGGKTLLGQ